jgi:hypothetical protein
MAEKQGHGDSSRLPISVAKRTLILMGQNVSYWPIWDISLAGSPTIEARIMSSAGHIGPLAD